MLFLIQLRELKAIDVYTHFSATNKDGMFMSFEEFYKITLRIPDVCRFTLEHGQIRMYRAFPKLLSTKQYLEEQSTINNNRQRKVRKVSTNSSNNIADYWSEFYYPSSDHQQ